MNRVLANPFFRYAALIAATVAAVTFLFPGALGNLLRADQFMPHATCYLRNPDIILLHVTSDVLIGAAYVAISLTLSYLVYKGSKNIPFHWMFLAFGLFIVTCGLTHFMEVWTVWQAVYWLAGYVKAICAAASMVTAVALVLLVPRIFSLINEVKVSEQRRVSLEAANAELEAFTYSVSHDLRAPLRAVQGMATAMEADFQDKLEPEAKDYLERILSASKRMDVLIQDLLSYSRVSRSEIGLKPVETWAAVEEALKLLAAEVERSGAEVRKEGEFPKVQANPTILVQVLANLLSNAIKFVAPGVRPKVTVCAERAGSLVRVVVKDNGIGISPEYRDKIFRIFERLHSASEYPGTGLGLAIVQKGALRMNGTVGFESTPGEGSRFWLELPRAD